MKVFKRIIAGAGASGLMFAALSEKTDGLIIDRSCNPGLKLLLSGSGQCNITHGGSIKDFIDKYGESGRIIRPLLYKASNVAMMQFIESLGVPLTERSDGKVFPKSMKASDVLKALLSKSNENGYSLRLNEEITAIDCGEVFTVTTNRNTYKAEKLIIACGGKSYPKTGSDGSIFSIISELGIHVTELLPSLTPIYIHGYKYRECSGVSFKNAEISVYDKNSLVCRNKDDLLLTHRAFSGPAAINISRYVSPGMTLKVKYVKYDIKETENIIKADFQTSSKEVRTYITKKFRLPASFTEALLKENGINPSLKTSSLEGEQIITICRALTESTYEISGRGSFAEAMVTQGGVCLDEINIKTMESLKYKNLYFIGEVLNIDGDTGGYNLQFAFSSASAANKDMD